MKTRNEIKEAIENRILLGDLSKEQVGHLRSELTVRRILNGEHSIEGAVATTRDLSPYTDNAKRLIACRLAARSSSKQVISFRQYI